MDGGLWVLVWVLGAVLLVVLIVVAVSQLPSSPKKGIAPPGTSTTAGVTAPGGPVDRPPRPVTRPVVPDSAVDGGDPTGTRVARPRR
jgi:hypothetical protein